MTRGTRHIPETAWGLKNSMSLEYISLSFHTVTSTYVQYTRSSYAKTIRNFPGPDLEEYTVDAYIGDD